MSSRTPVQARARYTRTNGNLLVGGPDNGVYDGYAGPGVNPSEQPPYIWWHGLDSGGGAYPIGPNGPWSHGFGEALPVTVRATSLITGPLTAAPFREVDLADGHPLGRARWITDPMTIRNDGRYPSNVYPDVLELPRGLFWAEWIRGAILFGQGAFVTQLDETGQPLAGTLRIINPLLLDTIRDSDGGLHWVLGADNGTGERAVFDRDGYITLGALRYRLVVLRNPHSSVDAEGRSKGVFEMCPAAFGLAGQIDSYAAGTYRSGVPAGFLKVQTPNLTQESADQLRTSWMRHHGGDRRSVAVLSSTIDFTPINLSPVDAALGESKRLNIGDVAMAFALDPLTLGVSLGNSATYNNLRDAWLNHRDFGLAPWVGAVEDTLTALLPGTQGVRVNLDGFANPPASERFASYETALSAGILTVDEVRALEGLPPLPASDPTGDQARALSQQEAVQKVYLGVVNGVISVVEAREMINDAGGHLDVDAVPEPATPEPEPAPELVPEERKRQPWRAMVR